MLYGIQDKFIKASLIVMVLLFTSQAHGHHAWSAVFTNEIIEIEGYVTEFNFKNPHVNIMLLVKDDAGVETQWMATGPAAAPFRSWGWTNDTVEVGQYLRLKGRKGRNNAPMIVMIADDIINGRLLELDPADGSTIRVVAGAKSEEPAEPKTATKIAVLPLTLDDGRVNLTGTWTSGPRQRREPPPFNEVGKELQANFDPETDPAYLTCSPPGLVRQVAFTPHPMRVTQHDDRIIFEYEEHGGTREIFLNENKSDADEPSRFGNQVARYEDDKLIIETSRLSGNLANNGGNALSDQTSTVEIYRRVDDSKRGPMIEMSMAISDPVHLTKTWNITWLKAFAAEGLEFVETDCKLPLSGETQ